MALLKALKDALDVEVIGNDVRIGREHAKEQYDDCRAVVQFKVSAELFDCFFNARTGYRAHFRADYKYGIAFNSQIIEAVCLCLDARLPHVVVGRELDGCFEDCGEARIPKSFVTASLTPDLSKIWFCTKLIEPDRIAVLPIGVVGPKILLSEDVRWAAPCREAKHSWLDVKGAFVGKDRPYQPKTPEERAKSSRRTEKLSS